MIKSVAWSGRTAGLHGVRTEGELNVDRGLRQLQEAHGHEVVDVTLPKRLALSARKYKNLLLDLERVLDETREGDALLGHSNGGYLAAWATRFRSYSSVILVNPALERDFDLRRSHGAHVHCIHSGADWVLRAVRYLPIGPRWGSAGVHGLNDLAPLGRNYRTTMGHSEIFEHSNVVVWAATWDRWIRVPR